MKVLHAISSMGPGGAERQLSYLARGLRVLGYEVHVALLSGGPNLDRLVDSGAVVHMIPARGNCDPTIATHLYRVIRQLGPALVQTWLTQMDVFAGAAALAAGRPWILSERNSALCYKPVAKNRLRARMARWATAVVANSDAGLTYWRNRVPASIRLAVVPNALPVEEILAAAEEGRRSADWSTPTILAAGRMVPEKNVEVMVRAIALATNSVPCRVVLCGDGPIRERVERLIVDLGCSGRFEVIGYASDLWQRMGRAAAFLSLSRYEGQPNVVLEAVAAKCPLVLSDIPAHRGLVAPECCRYVGVDDVAGAAQAVVDCLTLPDQARSRAAQAHAIVQDRSIPFVAAEYARLYAEAVQPPPESTAAAHLSGASLPEGTPS